MNGVFSASIGGIWENEIFRELNSFLETYFGVSETYKYLFLLYSGFIVIVIIVNLSSLLVNQYFKYKIENLEKSLTSTNLKNEI